jgi:hypothetical protein
MWTVQEVSLCFIQRLFIRSGIVEIPWGAFLMGYQGLKTAKYRYGRWKEAMALQQQLFTYLTVHRYPGSKAVMDDNLGRIHNDPLAFSVLINSRRKQATDPKDKIFALYGVLTELEVPWPRPDYALSVEEIFREAVIAAINYDKTLHILYHAPSDRRLERLSSWVPDWTEPGWEPDDPRYNLHTQFSASKSGVPTWTFSDNGSALILSGKVVDTVIYRTDPLPEIPMRALVDRGRGMSNVTRAEMENISQVILAASATLKTWVEVSQWADYPTGEPSKIALQRTLISDLPEGGSNYDQATIEAWHHIINTHELELVKSRLHALQLSDTTTEGRFNSMGWMFHNMVLAASQKKCFFLTENGYFGTAPDPLPTSLQPGDKIAIISGLEMPLLLRPVEGGYQYILLTHVYVHGIMHGEMWSVIKDDLEEIALV